MHDNNIFQVFTLLLFVAATLGWVALKLRQPLIIAFIATGILVGPAGLDWVQSNQQIAVLAEVGVTVLLFAVGLKLDMRQVRALGPVALATGLGQLGFTIVFGYLIAIGLGMGHLKALYVSVALTFSSTIIIVKLLSDKRELDSLHGRIAVGFLIVQDIAVVLAMMVVGSLKGDGAEAQWITLTASALVRMAAALALVALLMRYVLPLLMKTVARSQELLLIFAIAWGTALAALGELAGFSKEVGAFLAGFSLASSAYRESISTRLSSVRDFLLLFFFVELGGRLEFSSLSGEFVSAVVFALFVLIGNPLIVMAIMGFMGYRKRTGFMAGLTVAQISEFSIIFVAMGITLGHVAEDALGLITLVGLVTITLSTYMILYAQPLFNFLEPWLGFFERRKPFREMRYERVRHADDDPEVIVYGIGRYGSRLMRQLQARGRRVMGVDFDPEIARSQRLRGLTVRFGDAEDPDFPHTLPLRHAQWVVSTLPQLDINIGLIHALRDGGYRGSIAVVAHNEDDMKPLQHAGAQRVLLPFVDAADYAAEALDAACTIKEAA